MLGDVNSPQKSGQALGRAAQGYRPWGCSVALRGVGVGGWAGSGNLRDLFQPWYICDAFHWRLSIQRFLTKRFFNYYLFRD